MVYRHNGSGELLPLPMRDPLSFVRKLVLELDDPAVASLEICDEGASLLIRAAGGEGFVVQGTLDGFTHFHLVDPHNRQSLELVEVALGTSRGFFERQYVVGVELAVDAASRFASTRELAPELTWDDG